MTVAFSVLAMIMLVFAACEVWVSVHFRPRSQEAEPATVQKQDEMCVHPELERVA